MVTLHLISLSIALFFSSGQSSSWGSVHCTEIVHLATFPTHHAIHWNLLGGLLDPQYLQVPTLIILALVCPTSALVCPAPLNCIMFISLCFASIKTCSLVTLSVLHLALISLIIFVYMPSLSRPHINCSFIHLSCSKYQHFSVSTFTLFIHFSIFSSMHFLDNKIRGILLSDYLLFPWVYFACLLQY